MAPLAAVLRAASVGSRRSLSSGHVATSQLQMLKGTVTSSHGPQHQQAWAQRRAFSSGGAADPESRPPFPPFTFETANEKVSACDCTEREVPHRRLLNTYAIPHLFRFARLKMDGTPGTLRQWPWHVCTFLG